MRTRQLESFIRVCELGSLSRAAAQLHIAQPALGVQITSLEQELGTRLLRRDARGATPTPAGLYFLKEARAVLDHIEQIKKNLRRMSSSIETFTLGIPPSVSSLVTGRLLAEIRAQAPAVRINILEDFSHALINKVELGEIDLALAFNIPTESPIESEAILSDRLFFITAPGSPFDQKSDASLVELSAANFVIPNNHGQIRAIFEKRMRETNSTFKVLYEVNSMTAIKDLVARGLASAVLPLGAVAGDVERGLLVARRINDDVAVRTLFIAKSASIRKKAASETLVSLVRMCVESELSGHPAFEPLNA
jgi:LysR family nitrogen assimilation transcriptional regulator